ncbi:type 1 glutamine amidotransferase domain-containing protein [Micromonospora profundi]|uniref:Type 1 glutamine amidotransferase domain-containing protein n=1 Tax=Micromonospora profundi TaxID=1420889 RepID=A0AAJ6HSW1_9ACTN|nr:MULTISPECIES: type 1 glutamine amidotransferase domain-containing protein [Micromonospora]KOX05493.1 peptidase C56 [Micromonospora sp. NRRL B-16802]NJC15061.1 protease I [Micromonospora profundi]WLS46595.1 type 1 glutamine amidotransferase domain-containing protein [Micromonospora profundi]
MTATLQGKRIAFLATDGVEEVEYVQPREAVEKAGATAELVSLKPGSIQAFNHLDQSKTYDVDVTADKADAAGYDALVLPGGVANPDFLRTDPDAVRFVKAFFDAGKPVGVICHGPWTLIEADVLRGRRITSWPSLRTDLTNAGATWVDEECVTDGNLTSSRNPDDLPAFCEKITQTFAA